MKKLIAVAALAAIFFSCKNSDTTASAEKTARDTMPPKREYKLTPFSASAEFADARLESVIYKKGKFTFKIGGGSYQLGVQTSDAPQKMCANSAKGQHLHVLIDDKPYEAKYENAFDFEIADGEHYFLSFLSRSYHESIKSVNAFIAGKITVKDKSMTKLDKITEPMLFYSRPKGEYIGKAETEKVMLDFYLLNATLGADFKVEVDINGEYKQVIDKWEPYYIEGLSLGDSKIKLTLLDKNGQPVVTPQNPVERVFTLKEDPAPGQ